MFAQIPAWLEPLVIRALKSAVSPEEVAATVAALKVELVNKARQAAHATATTFDDKLVDMLDDAFSTCKPGSDFLCDLVEKGETALVGFLRAAAARTDTKLDDAAVDILAAALKAA